MSREHAEGEHVRWTWGAHEAEGRVRERFERRVQRTIDGSRIVRNGSSENPAHLVVQDDGSRVLKLHSELH